MSNRTVLRSKLYAVAAWGLIGIGPVFAQLQLHPIKQDTLHGRPMPAAQGQAISNTGEPVGFTAANGITTAALGWLDNFNDGSAVDGLPVTWTASPAFPSQFAVSGGDLLMTMPVGAFPAITSARVGVNFPTGASVRARMIGMNGPGRYTVAFADQPTGIKGYVASLSTCQGGRIELFRGDVLGAIVFIGAGTVVWSYGPLQEFLIQLDVFGGVVTARVWRPGEPFPSPQITAADATYSAGVASVAIQDFGGGTTGCPPVGGSFIDVSALIRFAQASAMPLTHSGAGDFNADGAVDLVDHDILVNVLLGAITDPILIAACDLNDDGATDGRDVAPFIVSLLEG